MFKYVNLMLNQYEQLFPLHSLIRHALSPLPVDIVL